MLEYLSLIPLVSNDGTILGGPLSNSGAILGGRLAITRCYGLPRLFPALPSCPGHSPCCQQRVRMIVFLPPVCGVIDFLLSRS